MLTFEMLEIAFFALLLIGMFLIMLGLCTVFIGLYSRNLMVKPKTLLKAGGVFLALSLIPMVMTMFV